jgi:hypothetical protein
MLLQAIYLRTRTRLFHLMQIWVHRDTIGDRGMELTHSTNLNRRRLPKVVTEMTTLLSHLSTNAGALTNWRQLLTPQFIVLTDINILFKKELETETWKTLWLILTLCHGDCRKHRARHLCKASVWIKVWTHLLPRDQELWSATDLRPN